MSRQILKSFWQNENLLKLFLKVHDNYHGKLDDTKLKVDDFLFGEDDQRIFHL